MPLQIPSNQSFLIYILSILCHLMGWHHHISFCLANLHTDLCYGRFLVMVWIKAGAANIIIMTSLSGQGQCYVFTLLSGPALAVVGQVSPDGTIASVLQLPSCHSFHSCSAAGE